MSYDINNYAMLAVSLPDFLETIDEGIAVAFESEREFVLLDQKFDELIKKNYLNHLKILNIQPS
jgi:hypothetical protein